jgi:hypothetical protein
MEKMSEKHQVYLEAVEDFSEQAGTNRRIKATIKRLSPGSYENDPYEITEIADRSHDKLEDLAAAVYQACLDDDPRRRNRCQLRLPADINDTRLSRKVENLTPQQRIGYIRYLTANPEAICGEAIACVRKK